MSVGALHLTGLLWGSTGSGWILESWGSIADSLLRQSRRFPCLKEKVGSVDFGLYPRPYIRIEVK